MKKVIRILANRDSKTWNEATMICKEVKTMLQACLSFNEAEFIMYSELGLEPDFIDNILFGKEV